MSKRFTVEYTVSVTLDESDAFQAGESATGLINELLNVIDPVLQAKDVWVNVSSNNYITDEDGSLYDDGGELIDDRSEQ